MKKPSRQVKIKIINAHYRVSEENPTLNEWAGINNGDEFYGTYYESNKTVDIESPCNYDAGEFGATKKGDFTELYAEEFEVIE